MSNLYGWDWPQIAFPTLNLISFPHVTLLLDYSSHDFFIVFWRMAVCHVTWVKWLVQTFCVLSKITSFQGLTRPLLMAIRVGSYSNHLWNVLYIFTDRREFITLNFVEKGQKECQEGKEASYVWIQSPALSSSSHSWCDVAFEWQNCLFQTTPGVVKHSSHKSEEILPIPNLVELSFNSTATVSLFFSLLFSGLPT